MYVHVYTVCVCVCVWGGGGEGELVCLCYWVGFLCGLFLLFFALSIQYLLLWSIYFHVGMTQRVPSVLKQLPGSGTKQHVGRKRGITPCPPVKEPLAEFIRNTCELCFLHTYIHCMFRHF